MSTTTTKKTPQGVRYSDAQKKEVVDYILSYNATNGRGGQSKAASKFKVSQITIASWLKAAGVKKAPKTAAGSKSAKSAKAPKSAKSAKAPKAAKTAKASGKGKVGTRYTPEQKKEVVDFVAAHNASNGRGGQSAAAAKYKVSPLTVMAWLKASGTKSSAKKGAKKGKPAASKVSKTKGSSPAGSIDAKLSSLLSLSKEIAKAESALAQLIAKFKSLKASL